MNALTAKLLDRDATVDEALIWLEAHAHRERDLPLQAAWRLLRDCIHTLPLSRDGVRITPGMTLYTPQDAHPSFTAKLSACWKGPDGETMIDSNCAQYFATLEAARKERL